MGVDRRDMSIALAARQITAAITGKEVELENLLPVKLWERPQSTEEGMESILDRMAIE